MKIRLFGCGKFRYLAIEKYDRDLSPRENDFYRKHREVCFGCMRYEQQGTNAMNLVRGAMIEPEISEGFDEKVLRALDKQPRRVVFGYWSPTYTGAAVAALAILATIQLVTGSGLNFYKGGPRQGAYNKFSSSQDTLPNLVLPNSVSVNH